MKAYDAAYAPNLDLVKRAGGVAVNHYLTGMYATSSTQPAAARAAGLGCILTYEQAIDELVNTSQAAGRAVGQRAVTAAALQGAPVDGSVAIFFSVDVNVADPRACDQAFTGIKAAVGNRFQVRAYAQGSIIEHLARLGLTDGPGWLAAPTSWPGFNPDSPNVCMVQRVGSDVTGTDLNDITDINNLGAWWPKGSPYGGDMPLNQADLDAIKATIHADLVAMLTDTTHPYLPLLQRKADALTQQVAALQTQMGALQATVAKLQPGGAGAPLPTKFTGTVELNAQ